MKKNITIIISILLVQIANAQIDTRLTLAEYKLHGKASKVVEHRYRIDASTEVNENGFYPRRDPQRKPELYVFDTNGYITESITYPKLTNRVRTLYTYDDQRRLIKIKEAETDESGEFSRFADVDFVYVADSMYTNATITDTVQLGHKHYVSVLKDGLVVWYKRLDDDSEETYELVYDDQGELKIKRRLEDRELSSELDYNQFWAENEIEYYPNGLMKKITLEEGTHTYQYLYDEHGNWIVQTVFEDGVAREVFVREIGYYE